MDSSRVCRCTRPRCSDFGLGGVNPNVFVQTQCRLHFAVLLVYRLLVTLYLLGYFLYNLIISVRPGGPYGGYYLIYLTNWGFILMMIYLLVALWNMIAYAGCMQGKSDSINNDVPWYFFYRGQWFLFNMYAASAILISILYWGALYVPGLISIYYDINFHLLNGLVAIIEIIFTSTVVRALHFIYPFIFGVAYMVFSGIYYAAGGVDEEGNPYIYPILDYGNKPALAAGLAVGGIVGLVVVHLVIVWGLYRLKLWIVSSSCCPHGCRPTEHFENEDRALSQNDLELSYGNNAVA